MKQNLYQSVLIILTILVVGELTAQEEKARNVFDRENKKYSSSLEKYYIDKSLTRTMAPQVLEDIIDADTYIVGPGDGFQLYLWSEMENQFNVVVNPQGSILIPSVGEIMLNGLTLTEAKMKIMGEITEKYVTGEVSVNLVTLKKFRVYITGEINLPGTYFVQASDRISDVLEIANGVTDWADGTRIEIKNKAGEERIVDLSIFYLDGMKEQNPFLQPGVVIKVPSIDINKGYVIVEGNAALATSLRTETESRFSASSLLGIYALKENEKLYDFMRRVGGLSRKSDLENVIVVRDSSTMKFDLLEDEEKFLTFQLADQDKIIITPIIDQVFVSGEVLRPGNIPFKANYRASDYVGEAGVLETAADQEEYIILRRETGKNLRGGQIIIKKGDTIIVPRSGSEKFKDFMVVITPSLSLLATVLILVTQLK